jgi:hypothetical protein
MRAAAARGLVSASKWVAKQGQVVRNGDGFVFFYTCHRTARPLPHVKIKERFAL